VLLKTLITFATKSQPLNYLGVNNISNLRNVYRCGRTCYKIFSKFNCL